MSQYQTLESSIMAEISGATDEAAIEAVRIAALGKKGSVSELLKGLGKMSAEERQEAGPAINGLKTRIADAIAARKTELRNAAVAERLARETVDVSLPVRSSPAERGRIHPITPGDRRDHRDLRRYGVLDCRRSGYRDRLLQFHRTQLSRRSPGARNA
jgi:phenylalanyl-tRNA synthetase alpha chain